MERFLRELKAKGVGRTTVRLTRALLHCSCRLARKWSGNSLPNPVNGAELPQWRRHERPAPVRAPEVDEVRALLDAAKHADPRVGTLIRLVAATGVRRGEACAVRWDDIDFAAGTVLIDEGVVSARGTAVARERPWSGLSRPSSRSAADGGWEDGPRPASGAGGHPACSAAADPHIDAWGLWAEPSFSSSTPGVSGGGPSSIDKA